MSAPAPRPARWLPIAYFAFAHLCLGLAFAALAWRPAAMAGFFYHPRLLAVVHLITLGWITSYALGATYVVGAIAFRVPLAAGRADHATFVLHVLGVSGMVAHFWVDSPFGMAWSAAAVLAGLLLFATRVAPSFAHAPVPGELRAHVVLAFFNLLAAASFGLLVAIGKSRPLLPGYVLANVAGHAHLALVGWATTLAVGVGYRLLPMILPAAPPLGRWVWASAGLLGVGAWTLFAGLVTRSRLALVGALVVATAIALFCGLVVRMLRQPRPPPRDLPRPDFAAWHALQAVAYAALAAGLGVALVVDRGAAWTMSGIAVYGVLALIGFLAQLIAGVSMRLLPLHAWLRTFSGGRVHHESEPPSVHGLWPRRWQLASFGLWSVGVPLLAAGFGWAGPVWVATGAGALLVATGVSASGSARVARVMASRDPTKQ